MKKAYTKPQILFEDFTLTTNIAAGCEVKTKTPSQGQCGVDMSGITVFMTNMTGCGDFPVENVGGDGEFNGLCYHVFSSDGANNLFNS